MAQIVTLDSGLVFLSHRRFRRFRDRGSGPGMPMANAGGGCGSPGPRSREQRCPRVPVATRARGRVRSSPISAVTRDIAVWLRLHLVSGVCAVSRLDGAVVHRVARANSEFAEFFFVHEHLQRFLTTEHRRAGPVALLRPARARRQPGRGFLSWRMVRGRAWREGASNAPGFFVAPVSRSFGPRSCSPSSARRARSCPPISSPCFRRWRFLTGWLAALPLDTRTLSRGGRLRGRWWPLRSRLSFWSATNAVAGANATRSQPPRSNGPRLAGWLKAALTVVAAGAVLALVAFRRAAADFWGAGGARGVDARRGSNSPPQAYDAFQRQPRSTSAMLPLPRRRWRPSPRRAVLPGCNVRPHRTVLSRAHDHAGRLSR